MSRTRYSRQRVAAMGVAVLLCASAFAPAADSLVWRVDQNRISADIDSWPLPRLLENVAAKTGWQVYLEPGTTHTVSARFKNLGLGDALRFLLGNLNFALVPQTNASPKLFVFRTSLQEATQLVSPAAASFKSRPPAKAIPNQLVVTLKPGGDIETLARRLGAKIVGRVDELNTYLLQFDSETAATLARNAIANDPNVAEVDYNFSVPRPPPAQPVTASSVGPLHLNLKPPGDTGRIIVGLIDTAVQPLGGGLDDFLLPPISMAGEAPLSPDRPTHGTTMAGTVLTSLNAVTKGSTSVQILPVDVYGKSPTSSTFDIAYGIVKAVNAGANPINLSLGSEGNSTFLHNVIQDATAKGIRFFGAAGNEPVTTPFYPAAYQEVTAVTAGDRKGQIAPYANRGSFVDLVAPGASVVYFNNQPWFVSGTSAATAFATGAAAGLRDTSQKSWPEVEAAVRSAFPVKPPQQ